MGVLVRCEVFFITGTSGAGKSTLVELLKMKLPLLEVHDFDEGGVPRDADANWRRERTNAWLEKAKQYSKEGKSTVICGVTVPKEVKGSSHYDKSLRVSYGYLHIEEETIRSRLKKRSWAKHQIDINVIWAKHLEAYVLAEKNHLVVDGTKNSAETVCEQFAQWILKK